MRVGCPLLCLLALTACASAVPDIQFSVPSLSSAGRIRVFLQRPGLPTSPLYGLTDDSDTNQGFGFDVVPTDTNVFSLPAEALGFPLASISEVPPGIYDIQAEVVLYETVSREGLPDTQLPTSCVSKAGNNGSYERPDGTIVSDVQQLVIDSNGGGAAKVLIGNTIPDSTPTSPGCAGLGDGVDSDNIKTVRLRSTLVSDFYGKDVFLEACVLLPHQFDDHPDTFYPLVVAHGHYSPEFNPGGAYSETFPDCDEEVDGYACVADQYAYYLHSNWTSLGSTSAFDQARMLLVTINHPVWHFDDSYAVNSENSGPYGDAIVHELIPHVEDLYRGIGEGWARGLMGGSTGGWESAAHMILYPDEFAYALSACPDSVTFSHHTSIDLYTNRNAYFYNSDFRRTPLPGTRDGYSGTTYPGFKMAYGDVLATVEEMNVRELVMGENSRSCGQFDAWEAVWSPVDETTGFPKRVFDKKSGEIDPEVVEHWKENWDLAHILVRDWETLGPKIRNKLHFAVGASDSFYLTNAVYDFQQQLEEAVGKDHGVEFVFGAHEGLGFQHCFRGYEFDADGLPLPNSLTRLFYAQSTLPKMAKSFVENAPAGADVVSWRY
jgi:hypothetical protein